jgi:hypothetical protein
VAKAPIEHPAEKRDVFLEHGSAVEHVAQVSGVTKEQPVESFNLLCPFLSFPGRFFLLS